MQTRSAWLHRLFAVSALVLLDAGCASRSGPATGYTLAYNALVVSYRSRMTKLLARPMPPASLPKEQMRAVLARRMDDLAAADTDYRGRLEALQPPASMREVQSTTGAFLKASADGNHRLAEAIRHGDREARKRVEQQVVADRLAAIRDMLQAQKRFRGTPLQLQVAVPGL